MSVTVEAISKLKYFAGLEQRQLEVVAQLFSQKVFMKGQPILAEGDRDETLHFVNSGVVKVFKTSPEGKEQIVKIIRPGESFNDVTVFSNGPCPYSAEALGNPTVIYLIHKTNLMPFIEKNLRIAQNAIEIMAEQERIMLTLVEDLSFKNVVGRVAKILLKNLEPGPDGLPKLTQYEMAAMAGTAREVVGRSLKGLEDLGAIRLEKHRIVIVDKDRLYQIAGMN